MPKYKECGHYDGRCPCVACERPCGGCFEHRGEGEGCTVDTDRLCKAAKLYCESGRAARRSAPTKEERAVGDAGPYKGDGGAEDG